MTTAVGASLGRLARAARFPHRPIPAPRPDYDSMTVGDLHAQIVSLRSELESVRELVRLGAAHPSVKARTGRLVRDVWSAEAAWLRRTSDVAALVAVTTTLSGRSL